MPDHYISQIIDDYLCKLLVTHACCHSALNHVCLLYAVRLQLHADIGSQRQSASIADNANVKRRLLGCSHRECVLADACPANTMSSAIAKTLEKSDVPKEVMTGNSDTSNPCEDCNKGCTCGQVSIACQRHSAARQQLEGCIDASVNLNLLIVLWPEDTLYHR